MLRVVGVVEGDKHRREEYEGTCPRNDTLSSQEGRSGSDVSVISGWVNAKRYHENLAGTREQSADLKSPQLLSLQGPPCHIERVLEVGLGFRVWDVCLREGFSE